MSYQKARISARKLSSKAKHSSVPPSSLSPPCRLLLFSCSYSSSFIFTSLSSQSLHRNFPHSRSHPPLIKNQSNSCHSENKKGTPGKKTFHQHNCELQSWQEPPKERHELKGSSEPPLRLPWLIRRGCESFLPHN